MNDPEPWMLEVSDIAPVDEWEPLPNDHEGWMNGRGEKTWVVEPWGDVLLATTNVEISIDLPSSAGIPERMRAIHDAMVALSVWNEETA